MPNRYQRDTWLSDRRLAKVSAAAERLFWRLRMKADDFGRFEADPRLVRVGCLPLHEDTTDSDVAALLHETEQQRLVTLYEVDGIPYGEVLSWELRDRRAKHSKYPAPPSAAAHGCTQPCADVREPDRRSPIDDRRETISGPIDGQLAAPPSAEPGFDTTDMSREGQGRYTDPDIRVGGTVQARDVLAPEMRALRDRILAGERLTPELRDLAHGRKPLARLDADNRGDSTSSLHTAEGGAS